LGDTLAEGASVFSSDEDPELIRDALPFTLKMIELLLESSPENRGMLLQACSTFTQYAVAFIATDAEVAELRDYDYAAADTHNTRARKMNVRARDYCLRRAELDYPGLTQRLQGDPESAVMELGVEDVETMYWLSASWGTAISLGLGEPALVADFPAVQALMTRALELDEDFNRGVLHTAFITLESLEELGGSQERAREHFHRAVELSDELDASPFLSLAMGVSLVNQDREEFERLLERALAVDPDEDPSIRLVNVMSQRRATLLLDQADELFEEPLEEEEDER
jgi:predicted anti-sigma-YlaC factor YlaD